MSKFLLVMLFISLVIYIGDSPTPDGVLTYNARYKVHADSALAFCKVNKMNTEFCLLFDATIHSGKKRMVIWDFKKDSIVENGLSSHGCCDSPWGEDGSKESPIFSNVSESHCSSVGKFRLGNRGFSSFGINVNYKMHGLEPSNSNAYKRIIVLHSWEEVPDDEIHPRGTPEGWGCPAVSNKYMRKLDKKLKAAKNPVLLWIYE